MTILAKRINRAECRISQAHTLAARVREAIAGDEISKGILEREEFTIDTALLTILFELESAYNQLEDLRKGA